MKNLERMCGVCLLKRSGADADDFGKIPRPAFHSTSHVASAPMRARLLWRGERAQRAIDEHVATLDELGVDVARFAIRKGGIARVFWSWGGEAVDAPIGPLVANGRALDGELLYEDRLRDIFEHRSTTGDVDQSVEFATKQLHRALGDRRPPPYYAVLLADGDAMGKAIESIETMNGHRRLGKALDDFSRGCRGIVEGYGGSLVYAGGDDVLALLPLHTALACADKLRTAFVDALARLLPGQTPTLSVGLGIAHHMDDMSDTRALAKRAEGLAKRYRGPEGEKNALGIVFGKRGGAPIEAVGSWKEEPEALDRRIEHFVRLLHEGALSSKAAYDLEDAVAPLLGPSPDGKATPNDLRAVVASIARRVLSRKRVEGGAAAIDDELRGRLERHFAATYDVAARVQALSNELQIALAFLPAYETAYGDLDEKETR